MQIVDYQPRHAAAWASLNEAWLTKHFVVEAKDRQILDDPQGVILDQGGQIMMAEDEAGRIVGCVSLIAMDDGGFEVGKMAVDDDAKGRGLGRRLMAECVARAKAAGAVRLYLESNSALTPAITLYRSVGFKDLPPRPTPYARADVWMELRL